MAKTVRRCPATGIMKVGADRVPTSAVHQSRETMAAADNNVRPWRQVTVATSRRARRSGLARLLLQLLELFQPSRKLLLLLAASLMPACIIPVGPDWQDPHGEENLPPRFVTTTPVSGQHIAADANNVQKFTITVSDPNVREPLFLKWLEEYPPVTAETNQIAAMNFMVPPSETGQAMRAQKTETFGCGVFANKTRTEHLITAVVSDRPFVIGGPLSNPLLVEDNGQTDTVTWTLNLPCPISP
jgi:hypothetical protein